MPLLPAPPGRRVPSSSTARRRCRGREGHRPPRPQGDDRWPCLQRRQRRRPAHRHRHCASDSGIPYVWTPPIMVKVTGIAPAAERSHRFRGDVMSLVRVDATVAHDSDRVSALIEAIPRMEFIQIDAIVDDRNRRCRNAVGVRGPPSDRITDGDDHDVGRQVGKSAGLFPLAAGCAARGPDDVRCPSDGVSRPVRGRWPRSPGRVRSQVGTDSREPAGDTVHTPASTTCAALPRARSSCGAAPEEAMPDQTGAGARHLRRRAARHHPG